MRIRKRARAGIGAAAVLAAICGCDCARAANDATSDSAQRAGLQSSIAAERRTAITRAVDRVAPSVVTVQTETENAGQSTHLILNGNESALLSADVQNDGVATFSDVTLAEGPSRSVQAECRDASGNVTRSSIASWSVTLAECQVAFTLPDPIEFRRRNSNTGVGDHDDYLVVRHSNT